MEGYRYFKLNDSETGSAEWFSVALEQNNSAALRRELLWQMVRPSQAAVWDQKVGELGKLKHWSPARMGVYRVPADYLVPTGPVSPDFLRMLCALGRCVGSIAGDGKHVSRNVARQVCELLGTELISKGQHLVMVADGQVSPVQKVWTNASSQVNTYSKEWNHWKVATGFASEAEVWCTEAKGQKPLSFREWPSNTIVQNLLSHTIYIYRASMTSKGQMVFLDGVLARTGETTEGVTTFQIVGNWLQAAKLTTETIVSIQQTEINYSGLKVGVVGVRYEIEDYWGAIESFEANARFISYEKAYPSKLFLGIGWLSASGRTLERRYSYVGSSSVYTSRLTGGGERILSGRRTV